MLLPGLLNDAELWRDQLASLGAASDCQVGDLTGADTLRAAAEAVLAAAPPVFALAGFSLGGYVAQEVLRLAPARVSRLALLDTAMRPDSPERARQRQELDRLLSGPGRFHGFGERLLRSYVDPSRANDTALLARVRAMTERLGPAVFLRQNRWERRDGRAVLSAFRGPALVLCGANDRITPPAEHDAMAACLPRASRVTIPDSGHLTPMEASDAVTRALQSWLAAPAQA